MKLEDVKSKIDEYFNKVTPDEVVAKFQDWGCTLVDDYDEYNINNINEPFLQSCLNGDILSEDIDNFIDVKFQKGSNICDYIGFNNEEYKLWIDNPNSLKLIFFGRKNNISISKMTNHTESEKLVARASSSIEEAKLVDWLKKINKL